MIIPPFHLKYSANNDIIYTCMIMVTTIPLEYIAPYMHSYIYAYTGVLYINWGEDTCPPHADTLYAGLVVRTQDPRGALQCLQEQVTLQTLVVPSHHINHLETLHYTENASGSVQPLKCAMCYVTSRSTKFSYLGEQSCPANWTTEYVGVLSSQHQEGHSESVCINESVVSEIDWSEFAVNDLDLVGAECDTVPCPDGQVPCAICTR